VLAIIRAVRSAVKRRHQPGATLRSAIALIVLTGLTAAAVLIRSGASGASPALPVAYGFDGPGDWAGGEVRPRAVYFGPAAACSSAA